jgi:uncharacterized protein (DUF427 family)
LRSARPGNEDEEVHRHLRDPDHRVDVRDSSRHVRVLANGEVIADIQRPKLRLCFSHEGLEIEVDGERVE